MSKEVHKSKKWASNKQLRFRLTATAITTLSSLSSSTYDINPVAQILGMLPRGSFLSSTDIKHMALAAAISAAVYGVIAAGQVTKNAVLGRYRKDAALG